MGSETVHGNELRRLEFVKTTSESVFSNTFKIAHSLYSSLRTRVPGSVDKQITSVESKVTELTAPQLNKLQDVSGELLTYADGKVDGALGWLQSKVPDNFVKAKDAYTQRVMNAFHSFKVDDAIAFAKTTSIKGYTLVTQAPLIVFSKSMELAQKAADNATKTTSNLWSSLKSSASMDKVTEKYTAAHDTIVAQPIYKNVYNYSKGMADYSKGTTVYKLSATNVYPVVSPLADPLLNKAQPYVDSVFEQLKPIAAST